MQKPTWKRNFSQYRIYSCRPKRAKFYPQNVPEIDDASLRFYAFILVQVRVINETGMGRYSLYILGKNKYRTGQVNNDRHTSFKLTVVGYPEKHELSSFQRIYLQEETDVKKTILHQFLSKIQGCAIHTLYDTNKYIGLR